MKIPKKCLKRLEWPLILKFVFRDWGLLAAAGGNRKAISKNAKLIIMDEPSAPLTEQETETLHTIVRQLKGKGITIIYISHRMEKSLKYVIEYQFFGMGNIYLLIRFLRPAVRP